MKNLLLSYFFLWLSTISWAQDQPKIDSLQSLLGQRMADTSRVKLLNELFMEYLFVDTQQAKEVVNEALSLSKKSKYKKGEANALNRMGIYFYVTGEYPQALAYYDSALTLFEETKNLLGQCKVMNNIGVIYDIQGKSDEAMKIYRKTTVLNHSLNDQSGIATAANNIANIFLYRGAYDSAMAYFRQGLEIREAIQENTTLGDSYYNIGFTHHLQGNYEAAIENFFKSLEIYEKQGLQWNIATAYQGLSSTFLDYQKLDKAGEFAGKALTIMESLDNKQGLADAYENLGMVAHRAGNEEKALEYYKKTLNINTELGDERGNILTHQNIGELFQEQGHYEQALDEYGQALEICLELGDKKNEASIYVHQGSLWFETKQYQKAYDFFSKAAALSGEIGSKVDEQEATRGLYEAAMKLGKYDEAYAYNQQYMALKDSLFNQKTLQKLNELENKYQNEKKEQEIVLLTVEKELQQAEIRQKSTVINIIIIVFVLILALGILLFRYYQQKARAKALLAEKDAEIKRKKIEELEKNQKLMAMDAMIGGQEEERKRIAKELHDGLGGLLSTVQLHFSSIQPKNMPAQDGNGLQKAATLLNDACGEVRRIAHNMMPGALIKLGLVPALQDICDAMNQSGIQADLQVFNVGQRLDEQVEISVYRIIQELLSNIRKHAKAREVIIQLSQSEDTLSVTVEDDGVGFNVTQVRAGGGIGLKSIESRVKYLNGSLDLDARTGEGTTVNLEIPLKKAVAI